MKLSIIIPCFNESKTIEKLLSNVLSVNFIEKEIIIVDDFSTDGTKEILEKIVSRNNSFQLYKHQKNLGKGAAIKTGLKYCQGDYILIQDADLEYNPLDIKSLLNPIKNHNADVVYGSRFKGSGESRVLFFWHTLGNKFLTFISNFFTNLNLTDMECCYKIFRASIIKDLILKEDRFGFEPEVTAKISKLDLVIYEVGVNYYGRTYKNGKKITWKDGFRAIYCIIRYNLFN